MTVIMHDAPLIMRNAQKFHWLEAKTLLIVEHVSEGVQGEPIAHVRRVDGGTFPVVYDDAGDRRGTILLDLLEEVV